MPAEAGEVGEHGVVLPPRLNLTGEKLEPHGCYLLENSQNIYIWVGRGVVPQLCMDLFDVKSYEGLRGGKVMWHFQSLVFNSWFLNISMR
jgi:protein transport protein SEC24